jgi:hypothetical protein
MPTFGDTTAGGDTFPTTNDRCIASDFVCPTNGTATQINIRFDSSGSGGANGKALLYADSAGSIGALLVASSAVSIPAGGGDLAFPIADTAVASGTTYWIASVVDASGPVWQVDATGDLKRREAHTYASPANPWGSDSGTSAAQVNGYVTYTEPPPPGAYGPQGSVRTLLCM